MLIPDRPSRMRNARGLLLPHRSIMRITIQVPVHLKGNAAMAQISANDPIVVLSYARTPMGGLSGALAEVSATDLGATAVKAAVERAGVKGDEIDRIYMGCVLPAGLGQAPARQAALKAGLPKSVEATTVNKV